MARTKYKTKPVASIWMWAGVTGSALAGTAMNGWIATQWFAPTMGPLMAAATGIMMSIMEYATAHYAFRRESGILGRVFCAGVLAFCILAFTLFATLAPLTKIIQQTLVDPTTTGSVIHFGAALRLPSAPFGRGVVRRALVPVCV